MTIMPQPPRQGAPDLAVQAPTASGASLAAGRSFTLTATVSNQGDGESAATTLRYYRSVDATITIADTAVGTVAIGALAPSGRVGASLELTAPSNLGTYYYGVCVDAVVGESDATNNCSASVQVEVLEPQLVRGGPLTPPRRPDLVVLGVFLANGALDGSPGRPLTFRTLIRNDGDSESPATTLHFYRSENPAITTSDTEVGTDSVAEVRASGSRSESVDLIAPSAPGTYYYGACVDVVAGETNTANNCSTSVEVTVLATSLQSSSHPDLAVGTPSVNNESPKTGTMFVLSVTVNNTGDAESPATTLRYYRSTDATITTSDTAVGTDAVGALAPSGRAGASLELTAPSSAGTYYYGACVDAVTDESDTTNNCSSSVRVTVSVRQQIDLAVSVSLVNEETPQTRARFAVFIDVSNHGSMATPATTVRLYRSMGSWSARSGTQVSSHPVAALNPDGTLRIITTTSTPSIPGTYYFGACVDAAPGESDTANNCWGSIEKTVLATSPRLTDRSELVAETPEVNHATPGTGAAFTLWVPVRNTGGGESTATTLRYYRSTDATITMSDTAVGTAPIVALPPSGGLIPSITLTAPSSVGTYYYGACVDAVAGEFDTANNCSSSVPVMVSVRQIDLTVSVSLVNEETPYTSSLVSILIKVDNNGNVPTPATTLRQYRSKDRWIANAFTLTSSRSMSALDSGKTLRRITATITPSSPGTYYYGACVDAVPGESDTTNNCSSPVTITVVSP